MDELKVTAVTFRKLAKTGGFSARALEIARRVILDREKPKDVASVVGVSTEWVYKCVRRATEAIQGLDHEHGWITARITAPPELIREFRQTIESVRARMRANIREHAQLAEGWERAAREKEKASKRRRIPRVAVVPPSRSAEDTKRRLLVTQDCGLLQRQVDGIWTTEGHANAPRLTPGIYNLYSATPADKSRRYPGVIVHIDDGCIYQKIIHNLVVHSGADFDAPPIVGTRVVITYDSSGRAADSTRIPPTAGPRLRRFRSDADGTL